MSGVRSIFASVRLRAKNQIVNSPQIKRLTVVALLLFQAASAIAAEPFFFIQLSDPQFGMFTNDKDFAQETANFEFAVATVNRLISKDEVKYISILGGAVAKANEEAVDEAGVSGYEYQTWFGFWVPKGTPQPIIEKLYIEVQKALADPTFQERIAEMGLR